MHVLLVRIKMVTDVGTNVQKRGTTILTGTQLHGEILLCWPMMLHAVLTIKLKVPMLNPAMLVSCLLISLKRTFIILGTIIEFLIIKQNVRCGYLITYPYVPFICTCTLLMVANQLIAVASKYYVNKYRLPTLLCVTIVTIWKSIAKWSHSSFLFLSDGVTLIQLLVIHHMLYGQHLHQILVSLLLNVLKLCGAGTITLVMGWVDTLTHITGPFLIFLMNTVC